MAAYKVKAAEDPEDVEVEMDEDEDDDEVPMPTMSVQQVALLASLKTTCTGGSTCNLRVHMTPGRKKFFGR
jgi:hypothetical protein